MVEVVAELIVTLDTRARGQHSPGYYGYLGPEFEKCLGSVNAEPHRTLMGRKTYELLNAVPEAARDDGWHKTVRQPGYLFSRTLDKVDWPGLTLVRGGLTDRVREFRADGGPELRVLGSLSVARQLAEAGLLERVRLYICPLVLPVSGVEPVFDGWPDTAFRLENCRVLDGRVLLLEYRLDGCPPKS